MQDPSLWARLEAFSFDAPTGSKPYSRKLQEAEGWSRAHTRKVIEEYRRFLYLTQVSPAEATPSEPVDRAWHLHLTYTRSYWEDLCGSVLRQPLHHEPGKGEEDRRRYREQYVATRHLYRKEFGRTPPMAIWPTDFQIRTRLLLRILTMAGFLAVLLGISSFFNADLEYLRFLLPMGAAALALGIWLSGDYTRRNRRAGSGCGSCGG